MIEEDLLLHLGGRLQNAALEYCEKHSNILSRHHISELLIDQVHRVTFLLGSTLTLRNLR
jgi:hypothetical protein